MAFGTNFARDNIFHNKSERKIQTIFYYSINKRKNNFYFINNDPFREIIMKQNHRNSSNIFIINIIRNMISKRKYTVINKCYSPNINKLPY